MPYRAPVKDIRFILDHVVGFAEVAATPRFAEATPDLAEAILTEAGRLSTEEAEAVRHNAAMGIVAGITVSFPEVSARSKGALGMIADPGLTPAAVDALFAARKDEILAVANMMHLTIVHLPQLSRHRALSPRQREALEWVADGKTTQDVALLMGVSAAMVEKHLRLAREALSVETTAQAVAKGALLNMIFQRIPEVAQAAR